MPLPAIPPKGPLKRLRLELSVAAPEVIAAAAAAAAAAVMSAALVAVVNGDGRDGDGEEAARAQAHAQVQAEEEARSRSRSHVDSTGSSSGCALPLRRLAPLLPPGLEVLDIWSCNASPPPPPLTSMSMVQSGESDSAGNATHAGSRKGRCVFERGGGGGGGGVGGAWRAAAGGDGEEAPAFDGYGSRGMWGGRQRTGASGGNGGGVGGGDGDEGCAMAGSITRVGVEVAAAPGDLISIAHACPALRELAIRGDPNQETPAVASGGVRCGAPL